MYLKQNLLYILFVICIVSCHQAPVNYEGGASDIEAIVGVSSNRGIAKFASNNSPAIERKVIRNGRVEMLTHNVEKMSTEIQALCGKHYAYIGSESRNKYNNRIEYEQTIRIPASGFDDFLKAVEKLGEEIESRSISSEDVTEKFIDLEARLKTKKELETRYLDLLNKAKSVREILDIENQAADTRADIESMQGKLNFLTNQVAYSTLVVVYYEPIGTTFGFSAKVLASLENGWENLLFFLIGILNIWPFVILIAVVCFFIIRLRRIRRMRKDVTVS